MNTICTALINPPEHAPVQAHSRRRLPGSSTAILRRHRTEFWRRCRLDRLAVRLGLSPNLLLLTLLYSRERACA